MSWAFWLWIGLSIVGALLLLCPSLLAQPAPASASKPGNRAESKPTVLILPFENLSKAPGLEWVGESFPEVLGQRLAGARPRITTREERLRAFDRAGVPATSYPSRALVFLIAEQLDVDYVVLGTYDFNGQTFTAACQQLDMKREHLSPRMVESGPLPKLVDVQTALAWDLLRLNDSGLITSRDGFVAAAAPIRLDALENYTRGVIAATPADRIKYFREALRLNPDYLEAQLALGEAYVGSKQFDLGETTLSKIPESSPLAKKAEFLEGLSALQAGRLEKAESWYSDLVAREPSPEGYNNLGVTRARRGEASALESLRKASETDPDDADYRFNLAVELFRKGDAAASTRELRKFLEAVPSDAEGKALMESLVAASDPKYSASAPAPKLPPLRVKSLYAGNRVEAGEAGGKP